jgi:hypothetical protein
VDLAAPVLFLGELGQALRLAARRRQHEQRVGVPDASFGATICTPPLLKVVHGDGDTDLT